MSDLHPDQPDSAPALARLAELVGSLAARLAHEINSPLAAVIGNLDMIAEDLARLSELGPAQVVELRSMIEDARGAADRVRCIVRDGIRVAA